MSHVPGSARGARRAVTSSAVKTVVLIVGMAVLAAVVVPPHGLGGCTGSKQASIGSNLLTLRTAIEHYAVQHEGRLPDERFVQQLCEGTDVVGDPGTAYGPYMRNGMPTNPVSYSDAVDVVHRMPAEPLPDGGWVYCTSTGEVRCDVVGVGEEGGVYWEL